MMGRVSRSSIPRHRRAAIADGCYLLLNASGWSLVTTACVVASYVLVFVLLGEFTLAGFLGQIDNMASRYLAAPPARQLLFERQLFGSSLLLFAVIGFFRRASLMSKQSKGE